MEAVGTGLPDESTSENQTDQERLLALLKDFGINSETEDMEAEPDGPNKELPPGTGIVIEQHNNPKVGGYTQFFGVFRFDKDGRFVQVSFWE
jgi:hypothetical protein